MTPGSSIQAPGGRSGRGTRLLAAIVVLAASLPVVLIALGAVSGGGSSARRGGEGLSATQARALGELPLSFEANAGQADPQVRFLARGRGYDAYLTSSEAVLAVRGKDAQRAQLRLRFLGASPVGEVQGLDQQGGRANYFSGADPAGWHTNVAMYARVSYPQVYPGIDVVYYGTRGALEYDFVVAPGADPKVIAMHYAGAERVDLDESGDLVVTTTAGPTLRQRRPVAFQDLAEGRRSVEAAYVVGPQGSVTLRLGHYDISQPLVVDPVVEASTYYGGSSADYVGDIALDRAGNVYLSGYTYSDDFPTTPETNAVFSSMGGADRVAVVVKLTPDLSSRLYATYLMDGERGGTATGGAMAVDPDDGSAYVGGRFTRGASRDFRFPTTPNPIHDCSSSAAFLTRLSPGGDRLMYSTCLAGGPTSPHNDGITSIAVAGPGRVWVSGRTDASDFPTTPGGPSYGGGEADGFLTQVDTNAIGLGALVFSTFVGGADSDSLGNVTVDGAGNVYVTGETRSKRSFLVPCRDPASPDAESILLKLDASGALQYATCGSVGGLATRLDTDAAGNLYMAGEPAGDVASIITDTAYQKGPSRLYMAKLDPAGRTLYATYFPGSHGTSTFGGPSVAADDDGRAYIVGHTVDASFAPKNAPVRSTRGGTADAFLAEIDTTKAGEASLVFATLLGGSERDGAGDVALTRDGDVYVFGGTASNDIFGTPGATGVQKDANGWFVMRIAPPPRLASVSAASGPACGGAKVELAGARLDGTSKVSFGDRDAEVRQVDDTHVEVVVPPRLPGAVEVTLTARSGTVSFPYTYVPVPAPVVSALNPAQGPVEGGSVVTISGSELACVRGVRFGDAEVGMEAVAGGLQVVAPAHARGPVDVVLSAEKGDGSRITSATGAASRFTYLAIPAVTAVVPDCGPVGAATPVAIQGRHLSGATGVRFGTATVAAIGDANPERIAAVSPPLPAGEVELSVTTPDGTSATVAGARFRAPCPAPVGPPVGDTSNNPAGSTDNSGSQSLATPTGGTGTPGVNTNPASGGANTPGGGDGGTGTGGLAAPGGGGATPAGSSNAGGGGGTTPAGPVNPGGGGGSPAGATTPPGGSGGSPVGATAPGGSGGSPAGATTPGGGGGSPAAVSTTGGDGGGPAGAASPANSEDPKEAPRYAMVRQDQPGPAGVLGVVVLCLLGFVMVCVGGHLRAQGRRSPAWARATA